MACHGVKPPRAPQAQPLAGAITSPDPADRQPSPSVQATAPLAAIAAARAAALAAASSQRAAAATAEAAAGASASSAAEAAAGASASSAAGADDARVTRQAMTDWAERDPISGQPALGEAMWAAADADKDTSLLPTSVQEPAAQAPVEIPNLRAAASAAATDEQMQSELLVEEGDQTLEDEADFTDADVDLHDEEEGLEAGRDVSPEAAVPPAVPAVPAVPPAVPAALPAKLGLAELAGVVRR